jgi:hypothetical protein
MHALAQEERKKGAGFIPFMVLGGNLESKRQKRRIKRHDLCTLSEILKESCEYGTLRGMS